MADDSVAIRKIVLFFYFCFLDENRAFTAARKVLRTQDRTEKLSWAKLVHRSYKYLNAHRDGIESRHMAFRSAQLKIPSSIDFSSWLKLRQGVEGGELASFIWVSVLGVPVEEVAAGLDVSQGTVEFRIHRVATALGKVLSAEAQV